MKILLIIVIAFFASSCIIDVERHETNVIMPEFDTLKDARWWIAQNIYYKSDNGEYFQTPGETIDRGTGDCEDYALLLAYYANRFGLKPKIGYEPHHAVCIVGDKVYSPQIFYEWRIEECNIIETESYQDALYKCPGYL